MTVYALVPATLEHVVAMEPHVRQADVAELAALGVTPGQALHLGLRVSMECWAGLADGECFCLLGLSMGSLLAGTAIPWLIGTDAIERHATGFLRRNRPLIRRWAASFDLWNYVDARNARGIKWLRWCGFDILPTVPYGVHGEPFHRFEMRRTPCAGQQQL